MFRLTSGAIVYAKSLRYAGSHDAKKKETETEPGTAFPLRLFNT